jgi:hypothetical protein
MFLFRKLVLFAIIFSLYISIAYAASFDVEAIPIKDRIIIDEFATFQLNIKNNLQQKDEFRIYTLDFPTWDVRTDPLINPITLELEPGKEGSVELVVDPLKIRDIGAYVVSVNVRSKLTNRVFSVPMKVTILSTEPLIGGYVPTVVTGVDIPEKIDPRKEVSIKISLNNQNVIDYPDLVVKLESNLIKDTIKTQLGPKEEKTLELTANLDPLTPPQGDRLAVAVFRGNRSIINPIVKDTEIIEYTQQELVSEEKKFFITKSLYSFVSNNKEYKGTFKVETTLFDSIFSSTNPKAETVKENGKRYFAWDTQLDNNRMQVAVTKNFIPLYVVIAVLIVLAISYYMFRSPLSIIKEVSNLVKSEGGVTEIGVVLHVRNRSQNKLKEIEVTEIIPSLVSIERETTIGSLQPNKVLKHERKGTTLVKWTIDTLDASEERVLSYKIKSRLSILGSFSFPAAKAKFKSKNKTLSSMSNRLSIEG